MVLSDDPLTMRVSSNWTQEIPVNNRNMSAEICQFFNHITCDMNYFNIQQLIGIISRQFVVAAMYTWHDADCYQWKTIKTLCVAFKCPHIAATFQPITSQTESFSKNAFPLKSATAGLQVIHTWIPTHDATINSISWLIGCLIYNYYWAIRKVSDRMSIIF